MRKKLIILLLLLCLAVPLSSPAALADGNVYFTAVNDTLLPLNASTMPAYIDGVLYLPYALFTSNGLDIYYASFKSGGTICLYSKDTTLFFDLEAGNSFNGDSTVFDIRAEQVNGTIYVPAYFVCGLFGLSCNVLSSSVPAPVVRVKSGAASYSDTVFSSIYKSQMESALDIYYGVSTETGDTTGDAIPSYRNVTIYMSFRSISGGYCGEILDALDSKNIRSCFFVTSEEISENADLIRRICGSGHSVGIYLERGTYEEYENASSLLFEAAKAYTIIVSSPDDSSDAAKQTANEHGLIYWTFDGDFSFGASKLTESALIGSLPIVSGRSENLMFSCSEPVSSVIPQFLLYLKETSYNLRQIDETCIPAE